MYIIKLSNLRAYYRLTKPGIVGGNVFSAIAGFLMVSNTSIDFKLLLGLVAGVSLVIASACVLNNYFDRHIDAKMDRTKRRALVTGSITNRHAIIYATSLGVVGFLTLGLFTNWLTVTGGLIGYVDYVILYAIAKRRSAYGAITGSISGSASLVAGYVAVTDSFDATAAVLFLIMVFWQMAHFHSIALRRVNDYRSAGLQVLPVVKGQDKTKSIIKMYIVGFAMTSTSLFVLGGAGYAYLLSMLVLSWVWLWKAQTEYADSNEWARAMFKFSLIVLVTFCLLLSFNTILP